MYARVVALALASVVLAAPAQAQPRRRPARGHTPHDEARNHFYDAMLLYEQGNLEGAITEFRASFALEPLAVVHFNLAQCLKGLYRYDEAIREYERYLSESGEEVPRDRRTQVNAAIAELRRLVAPITLDVEPAGADVRIDGRAAGTAPLARPLRLAAGRRVVEVSAEGYVPLRDELEVVARRPRTIRIRLPRRETAGLLRVRTSPARARVRIDGLDVGAAPVERRVTSGGHVVEATAPAHEPYRASVQLAEQQTLDLLARLERERPPPLTSRWWFWAGVSAAAVVAVVLTIVLWPPIEQDPVPGNVPPHIVAALRAP